MQQTLPPFSVLLGPLLGFLFTLGTLLFVALNAHRTVPAANAELSAPEELTPAPSVPESVLSPAEQAGEPGDAPRENT